MNVCMFLCGYTCMSVLAIGGQKLTSHILIAVHVIFIEAESSLNLELSSLASLVSSLTLGIPLSGLQVGHRSLQAFSCRCQGFQIQFWCLHQVLHPQNHLPCPIPNFDHLNSLFSYLGSYHFYFSCETADFKLYRFFSVAYFIGKVFFCIPFDFLF